MKIRLRIALKAPGKNDLRPDPRVMRIGRSVLPSAYLRWKGIERKWERALQAPTLEQRATGRCSMRFVRIMSPREKRMDRWNLEGGLNLVVVDMLVRLGWLIDDAEHAVEMLPAVQRLAGLDDLPPPATYIEIEDIEDGTIERAKPPEQLTLVQEEQGPGYRIRTLRALVPRRSRDERA